MLGANKFVFWRCFDDLSALIMKEWRRMTMKKPAPGNIFIILIHLPLNPQLVGPFLQIYFPATVH